MKDLRFTLVTDGPSDGVMLVPILEWLIRQHCGNLGVNVIHARPSGRPRTSKPLKRRIEYALLTYPCECLLVHRDAEAQAPELRRREIQEAVESLVSNPKIPHVCVVPIRMTEAWLLFDEAAIRHASGNPNGKISLDLPKLANLEESPDPKRLLHEALTKASELNSRRRDSFKPKSLIHLVARSIDDFSLLRNLSAFLALESEVKQVIATNQWNGIDQ